MINKDFKEFLALSEVISPIPAVYIYLSRRDLELLKETDSEMLKRYLEWYLFSLYGPITRHFVSFVVKTASETRRFLTIDSLIEFIKEVVV